jgi:hypothetical protein
VRKEPAPHTWAGLLTLLLCSAFKELVCPRLGKAVPLTPPLLSRLKPEIWPHIHLRWKTCAPPRAPPVPARVQKEHRPTRRRPPPARTSPAAAAAAAATTKPKPRATPPPRTQPSASHTRPALRRLEEGFTSWHGGRSWTPTCASPCHESPSPPRGRRAPHSTPNARDA